MRNRIILIAIAVLGGFAFVAIAGAWSISHKTSGNGEPTKATSRDSPHDIMVKRGSGLPVEYWSHPY